MSFEVAYILDLAKIRKLILFGRKCPNLGIWAQKFQKPVSDLKSAPSEQGTTKFHYDQKVES